MWDDEPTGLTVQDGGSVADRAAELGLRSPEGVCLLPGNFFVAKDQSDLAYEESTPNLKVVLRRAGVNLDKIEPDGVHIPHRAVYDATWLGPIVLFGATALSQNPALVSITLNVISNYLTDVFKGKVGPSRVTLGVVVEKTDKKTSVKWNYDGPVEGLKEVEKQIKAALK